MNASAIGAWLATYAIHSTILLGSTILASRFIQSHTTRETLLKFAIVGGIATSTLVSVIDFAPATGRWHIAAPRTASTPGGAAIEPNGNVPGGAEEVGAITLESSSGIATAPDPSFDWVPLALALWAGVSVILIARLVVHHRKLFAALSSRTPITDGHLPGMLAELRRKAAIWTPVQLSASTECPTPIALRNSEICVPARFATDLDLEQQKSALAHELAHLKRHDPVWQMGIGIIESVFFFQPLNVIGRKRLRDASEFLCDDWAVEQTNSPLALARCLTQISSWVGSARVPDGMLAMAEGGSPLITRIQRLASWQQARSASVRLTTAAATGLIAIVATSAPVFSAPPSSADNVIPVMSLVPRLEQAASPDSVIHYSGPPASLDQRWAWALRRNSPGTVWIGWEVDSPPAQDRSIASSSLGVRHPDASSPSLTELVGGGNAAGRSGILIRIDRNSNVTGVRLQSMSDATSFGTRHLIWLSRASASESVMRIRQLAVGERATEIRSELAAALAIHADPAIAVPAILAVIDAEGTEEVRVEAVQWMARLHGTHSEAIAILIRLAMQDRQKSVQMEAVDGLRTAMHDGSDEALAALRRIADSDASMSIRSEAMQSLSR